MFEWLFQFIPLWFACEFGSCMRRLAEESEDERVERIATKVISKQGYIPYAMVR